MILADTNFWLALSLSKHSLHKAAQNWFSEQSVAGSVLFCRSAQLSFLRLLTTDAVMRPYGIPSLTNAAAWKVYEAMTFDKRIACASEDDSTSVEPLWKAFAARGIPSPKLWMDAYLAALAKAKGLRLVTSDKGFRQFRGLDVVILTAV